MFADILKVGALACFYPVQSVLTTSVLTSMLARFGPEVLAGYGIGARLEFFLTSIAFSCGVASMPMVGMAVGAGKIARARRVAWTGAAISAIGVGALVAPLAVFPDIWTGLFTDNPLVRKAAGEYLLVAGPMFAVLSIGISLYFSSQGAAKVLGSVLAQTVRLSVVLFGGLWLLEHRRELHLVFRAGRRGDGRVRAVHRGDGSHHLLGHGAARRRASDPDRERNTAMLHGAVCRTVQLA